MWILALGLLTTTALLQIIYGLLNAPLLGHDSHLHPMWLEMFSKQVAEGNWYPHWLSGTYAGFGSPTFYFYPPLTYWLGCGFTFLIGGASGSHLFHAVQIFAGVIAFTSGKALLRALGVDSLRATTCALLYAFSPYSFIDLFARSSLSEYVSLAWIPLVFLGSVMMLRQKRHGWTVSVIAWVLLITTSIPASCCVFIAWLAFIACSSDLTASLVLRGSSALLMALGLASIYLIPAVGFSSWIQLDQYHTSYEVNALRAWFNSSQLGSSLLLGVTVIFAAAVYIALRNYRSLRSPLPWTVLLVISIILQLPFVSDRLYQSVLPFSVIRYPWRFTIVGILGVAVILAEAKRYYSHIVLLLAVVSLGLYTAYGFNHLGEGAIVAHSDKRDAPEYVNKFAPSPDSSLLTFVKEHEHEPLISAVPDLELRIDSASISQARLSAIVTLSNSGWVRFHQFFWPTWRVTMNGKPLQIRPDSNGMLTAFAPAGSGLLEARIVPSNLERTAGIVSLISLLLFALVQIFLLLNARKRIR